MTDEELYRAIFQETDDYALIEEIKHKLKRELDKPIEEQNYELIDSLAKTVDIITGEDRITSEVSKRGIQEIKQVTQKRSRKKITIAAFSLAAAFAIINYGTYFAHGTGIISEAIQYFKNGVVIDLSSTESDSDNDFSDYEIPAAAPYGKQIQELCKEKGFYPLVPSYLPEGFQQTDVFGLDTQNPDFCVFLFYFKSGNKKLNFTYKHYTNKEAITPVGLPTDSKVLSEQFIDETKIYIAQDKTDHQFAAAFLRNMTEYTFLADGLSEEECQRILESMFQ